MTVDYPSRMAELDHKMQHVHTMDDWRRVGEKPPESLTDDDITIIGFFGGANSADAAHTRREKAFTAAPVAKTATPSPRGMRLDPTAMADMIVKAIRAACDPLAARIATLEARPAMRFCGTWTATRGATFEAGDVVVHRSATWVCTAQTVGEPGRDFDHWQLIQKSPRENR
ncbi:MAG TPA: hypothetical protein VNJ02_08055 [Vicinamibacterales bacterium]|nr:hypothetical protein [Vicinamibacterales bacterium]